MTRQIRPIRIEGNIAFVTLTKGYETVIDASDADAVSQFSWFAMVTYCSPYAARRCRKAGTLYLHRFLLRPEKGMEVDHIDGNPLNNRRHNLRLATHSQNAKNRRMQKNNTSGFKGVSWHKSKAKWRAVIKTSGRLRHVGYFETPLDAHHAYQAASIKEHGDFRRQDCNPKTSI